MGLQTDFYGQFTLDRPLTAEHHAVLEEFAEEEHEPREADADRQPPNLYCQWRPTPDGTALEWDGAEKFYDYGEWLEYLIAHFLKPWGYTLSGEIRYNGWTEGVAGTITVTNNQVTVIRKQVVHWDA